MSTTVRALKLSGNPNGLGFLQQIGESFGTRPKASNKGEYFYIRIPAANRRECRNSPEGNGWREDLIWISTNRGNKKSRGWISSFVGFWPAQNPGFKEPRGWIFLFPVFCSRPKRRKQEIQGLDFLFPGFYEPRRVVQQIGESFGIRPKLCRILLHGWRTALAERGDGGGGGPMI